MTKSDYARCVIRAVFSTLRDGAPLIPGATPEFLELHVRALKVAEVGILAASDVACKLDLATIADLSSEEPRRGD